MPRTPFAASLVATLTLLALTVALHRVCAAEPGVARAVDAATDLVIAKASAVVRFSPGDEVRKLFGMRTLCHLERPPRVARAAQTLPEASVR